MRIGVRRTHTHSPLLPGVTKWSLPLTAPSPRGRRRRHGRLDGLVVVERVHLEPKGADPQDDAGAHLSVAAGWYIAGGGGEAAVAVISGAALPQALRHSVDEQEGLRSAWVMPAANIRGDEYAAFLMMSRSSPSSLDVNCNGMDASRSSVKVWTPP
jgi:hypothetical protein